MRRIRCLFSLALLGFSTAFGSALPEGFVEERFVDNLRSPSAMAFGPGGNLFVAERVVGELRMVNAKGKLRAEPVLRVLTPRKRDGSMLDGRGHRSGGLRGFAFDPEFPGEPYLYVFYMHDAPRHNRLSRFTLTTDGTMRAVDGSEKVLIDLPFREGGETGGSHNGGAVLFGADGKLYVTTGDGFDRKHDSVQSLETFTGKVLRLNRDGSIPDDNPFRGETRGAHRSIYALGLRNPYALALDPSTGTMLLNDCSGRRKAAIYKLEAGANFGVSLDTGLIPAWKESYVGRRSEPVADAAIGKLDWLVTGGAWYPKGGSFPEEYHGSYFVALWGFNNDRPGAIHRLTPGRGGKVVPFASGVGLPKDPKQDPVFLTSARKPASLAVGPDGNLYWLGTTYRTSRGAVYRIAWRD
ncbi:glucose/sorbosone dehydrogenase protein [Haloferula helveola]|uniref:Glucose/sorbosone dehydrogenase protein n=1 Tax=Haloferula helveola TaxID=490095 RepID=A0ABM7R8Q7_9BACT|nr:glucose/sorbosone dehydrogenase protein [Haloferula helveola]